MSTIGDLFPKEWNDDLAKQRLTPGAVLKLFVHDTTPPKVKMFVITGLAYDKITIATVYINSEINPNVYTTEELKKLHIPLIADDRNIVAYDSFINCSSLFEKNMAVFLAHLQADPNAHLGYLTEAEFKQVRATIKAARTISAETKKKYGLFL